VDDNYKPAFRLDSTNTSWDYDDFGEDDGLRTAAWQYEQGVGTINSQVTANHGGTADPWSDLGVKMVIESSDVNSSVWLYNPCGITNANFQNGEKYADDLAHWGECKIQSSADGASWTDEYSISAPGTPATWGSWSQNETITAGKNRVRLRLVGFLDVFASGEYVAVEAADITLTLNSSNTPDITVGSEQGNYTLALTLSNNTTGDSLTISTEIALNETLEIDTGEKTVTYLADNSNRLAALALDSVRQDWLRLAAGSNTLQFDDTGTAAVTVTISYPARYYS
jgi:hypothetical protein